MIRGEGEGSWARRPGPLVALTADDHRLGSSRSYRVAVSEPAEPVQFALEKGRSTGRPVGGCGVSERLSNERRSTPGACPGQRKPGP
jgi:hypothetical protein